jgi:excinuclease ABC subunit C
MIKLSLNEPIPRFSIVRRRTNQKNEDYFGPYLSARSAQQMLEFLRDLYGVHISNKPLKTDKSRACFHCQLTGHPCPCAGEISQEAYLEKIDKAVSFLKGKRRDVISDLKQEMERAAKEKYFERAAKLRDRLFAIQQATTPQSVITTHNQDYDALGVASSSAEAVIYLTHIRGGYISGQKHFYIENSSRETNGKIIRDFLTTIYPTLNNIPSLIVISEELEDQKLIELFLAKQSGHRTEVRTAKRGEKLQMVKFSIRNADAKLQQRLIKNDKTFEGLVALKELLDLPEIPERLEAIDISNLGASEPVGASVCFINGKPEKNEYRRYLIKTVQGQNDFAMIREVVARRLSDPLRPWPNLLVIDGGPEQLKFALSALNQPQQEKLRIIALAKKPDRVFVPGRKTPLPIKRSDKGLLLLAHLRDEAHRYCIGFQRTRQRKKSLEHS